MLFVQEQCSPQVPQRFVFLFFFNRIINPNPNFCLHDKVTQARVCGHYGENTQGEILLKDGERKYFL